MPEQDIDNIQPNRRQRLKPGPPLLWLLGVYLAITLFHEAWPLLGYGRLSLMAWAVPGVLLLLVMLFDALSLLYLGSPGVQRSLSTHLPLGHWAEVELHLSNPHRYPLQLRVFDHHPDTFECRNMPQTLLLPLRHEAVLRYQARPLRRGDFSWRQCELLQSSPLRLWQSRRYLALENTAKVFPDFARLHGAQLLGLENWFGQLGVRKQQRLGQGMEFHQLREFQDGDSLRQIDWKATARKQVPIVREYQDERDQQILLLLNCGRHMRNQDQDLSHFDHALNAGLLLAYVALRHGDAVGLATFAAQEEFFLPPAKSASQFHTLLNKAYGLLCTRNPSDYQQAVHLLMARQKKRAMVIILSNLHDEEEDELIPSMKLLSNHHQILFASLRENILDTLRREPVHTNADALSYCGNVSFLNRRNQLMDRLSRSGLPLLDVRPDQLGPELISRYLSWKKTGVL